MKLRRIERTAPLLLGLLLAAPSPPASHAAAPPHGVVEGTVHVEVSGNQDPPMLNPYARRRYRPPAAPRDPGAAENVVVWVEVEGAPGAGPATLDASVVQRNRTIIPHVAAIRTGTRVRFPNEDEVFHNLFSLSDTHSFNLGRYPPGESRSETFDEPGVVRVFCDIHSEMASVILVLDTPWFTRPDESGRYRIEGVPAGRYRVVAWHGSEGADTSEVVVTDGGTARVDFRLPR